MFASAGLLVRPMRLRGAVNSMRGPVATLDRCAGGPGHEVLATREPRTEQGARFVQTGAVVDLVRVALREQPAYSLRIQAQRLLGPDEPDRRLGRVEVEPEKLHLREYRTERRCDRAEVRRVELIQRKPLHERTARREHAAHGLEVFPRVHAALTRAPRDEQVADDDVVVPIGRPHEVPAVDLQQAGRSA